MSGRNVVPMPQGTSRPAPQAAPQGQMMPMPQMWGGGSSYPAGCCPPGDMSALLQCYCDIQAATAFISKVVTDLAANDPEFQKALVDGIAASGSNLPLIGVTNGVDAQPGQVGEWVQMYQQNVPAASGTVVQTLSLGVLQPGDWDVWAHMIYDQMSYGQFLLNPVPAGFSGDMNSFLVGGTQNASVTSGQFRALISVPSLIAMSVTTQATAATTFDFWFNARRRR